MSHLQAYAGADDGVFVRGGTVRLDHVMIWAMGLNGLRFTEGWNGGVQYAFLTDNGGSNIIGHTNFTDSSRRPVSEPQLWNVTLTDSGGAAMWLFPETGAHLGNSFFGHQAMVCLDVDPASDPLIPTSLSVRNTLFWNCGGTGAEMWIRGVGAQVFATDLSYNNLLEDHGAFGPGWIPPTGSTASGFAGPAPATYDTTAYLGAFVPGTAPWTDGWAATAID